MVVANACPDQTSGDLTWTCPHPGCQVDDETPSKIARHYRQRHRFATGTAYLLFSVCQVHDLTGERIVFLSDRCSIINTTKELPMPKISNFALHPDIISQKSAAPTDTNDPAARVPQTRKRAQPEENEPPAEEAGTPAAAKRAN